MRRLQLRFRLATLLTIVAVVALGTGWGVRLLQAKAARGDYDEARAGWGAEVTTTAEVCAASEHLLRAELGVPFASHAAAHTRNVERLGQTRYRLETIYQHAVVSDLEAAWKQMREMARIYTQAVAQLIDVAGPEHAKRVDAQFNFPFRDKLGPKL